MRGSIDSIETMGLVDGPGIRTVVFLNGCKLRCKFCHNPETWTLKEKNIDTDEIVTKVLRNKPYFNNVGGVTFSGGEPLLQYDFLVDVCRKLKDENIHICIDTAGIGNGEYTELLKLVDIVLLDVKAIDKENFIDITQQDLFDEYMNFIRQLNDSGKEVWIRQVIIPGINDNLQYVKKLVNFIKENINNVTRVDFLPYHRMGLSKYEKLNIKCPYEDKKEMSITECNKLYAQFDKLFKEM